MKWGFHLALDIAKCNPIAIRSKPVIYQFSKKLVKDIDMVAYGEPQIVMFGTGNKAGYTLLQLIETSNITAHFCEEDNGFFLDVFSCKPYDTTAVIDCVKEFFDAKLIKSNYFERDFPQLK
jgi:S-adenosylmethionine/arginine decarboxylase-like enzyme